MDKKLVEIMNQYGLEVITDVNSPRFISAMQFDGKKLLYEIMGKSTTQSNPHETYTSKSVIGRPKEVRVLSTLRNSPLTNQQIKEVVIKVEKLGIKNARLRYSPSTESVLVTYSENNRVGAFVKRPTSHTRSSKRGKNTIVYAKHSKAIRGYMKKRKTISIPISNFTKKKV